HSCRLSIPSAVTGAFGLTPAPTPHSFLFSCPAPPRALHSFPTRRSSDLGRLRRLKSWIGNETFMMTYGDGVSDVDINRLLATSEDRKSTRLNSSHRTISYAVFCLKKKKIFSYTSAARGRSSPRWSLVPAA